MVMVGMDSDSEINIGADDHEDATFDYCENATVTTKSVSPENETASGGNGYSNGFQGFHSFPVTNGQGKEMTMLTRIGACMSYINLS